MSRERDRQYEEYLRLREQSHRTEEPHNRPPRQRIEETPYGNSEMRRRNQDDDRRRRELEEYYAAREHRAQTGRGSANRSGGGGNKKVRKPSKKNRNSKGRKARRAITVILASAVVITAALVLFVFGSLSNINRIDIDESALGIDPNVAAQLDGYRNIAVLGVDARDMSDDTGSRTDSIIVASINEETDEVKLFSVFRDTYLYVGDEHGYDKITHAYAYDGPEGTLYTLNKNLDLDIDEVVIINWKAVADTVDAVGGIEVDVQESEINEMNKYIPETAKNTTGDKTLISAPGMQTLNGVQAVTYSRIRKDAVTGDYRRNERMKIVVQATFDKVKTISIPGIFRITNKVFPEVKSNMSSIDMIKLALKVKNFTMEDSTTGFPYDVANATMNGVFYGAPRNLGANVTKLHEQFFNQAGYTPSDSVRTISNEISYRTGIY